MHHELTSINAEEFNGANPSDVLLEMGGFLKKMEEEGCTVIVCAISLSYLCSKYFPEEEDSWDGTLVYEYSERNTGGK